MLKKIILKNFKSFKNETEIDFSKTNYDSLRDNVNKDGILKGCIFVGANASGKSNILFSLKLLLDYLFNNESISSGLFLSLLGGSKTSFSISYVFVINSQEIKYEVKVKPYNSFIEEKLYILNKLMMERKGTSAKSYIASENAISYGESDVDKETLFLRTLYFNTKFASNKTLQLWMEFMQNSVYINALERQYISYSRDRKNLELANFLKEDGLSTINRFFEDYNFEQQIEYEHRSSGENFTITLSGDETRKGIFFKRMGVGVPIPFKEESLGNQHLLRMLPSFFYVIEHGGMLLIDEFSSSFHNNLEALFVRYFMKKSENSQMIFVSHSTNLLSNSILRPDQEYSVEFNGKEGSSVIRFSTEQPRLSQNIEKMYVSGVFGGLPKLEEKTDEDKQE